MKNRGFTLIELLVAMAIIGILATVGLGAFFTSQLKARDARRKSDLGQIQKALEMYYNDNDSYPPQLSFGVRFWDVASEEVYMKEVPNDPKWQSGAIYDYGVAADLSWYNLYARIENENDPDPQVEWGGYSGTDCGNSQECNYKVSSPNAP